MRPLRIGIDARLDDGQHGGVQQVVLGLATALSRLESDREEYRFLVTPEAGGWIQPWLSGACEVLEAPARRRPRRPERAWRALRARAGARFVKIPVTDGTIERAGIDVMHFTVQTAFLTRVPSIYVPHDLQHLHLPAFMRPQELVERTACYERFCREARLVVALSSWGKRDLERAYGLAADRVAVVPNAPSLEGRDELSPMQLADIGQRLDLPDRFVFFPAATWPHKNHVRLLEALALLRHRDGLTVPLVCSGLQTDHFREIAARTSALGLTGQVRHLGWISPRDLRGLYALADALVFTSLFEGFGMPVVEAFAARVPVACSNVASLPGLARDAALLFDPSRANEIADAVARIWKDADLRRTLVERGLSRAADFSWDRSARLMRAHYRRVGGRPLDEADTALLQEPPTI